MRGTLARMYWLAAGLGAAACGGATGDQLFGAGGGPSGTSGSGGSPVAASGGTGGNAGTKSEGGTALGGGAGQAAEGGSAGTSSMSGGTSGNGGSVSGGSAGKGGAAGSAAAGGSAGKGGTGGSAGRGGAGGSGGAIATGGATATGGVSSAGGQATCDAMRTELPKLLTAAQVCDISLDRVPCAGFVSNECGCKVPVDAPSLPAAQSYVNAVAAVSKCGIACPAIVCAEPVAAHCLTEGTQIKGRCVVGAAL